MGALGPGSRANLTIGRALRLLVALTGEGMPGRLDRSTLGQPGKVGICLAEDEERSPWPPLPRRARAYAAAASVVTMLAGDAPLSISEHRSRTPEELAAALGLGGGDALEPQLVAARLGDPLRHLPGARRHAGGGRLEQGRRPRRDLAGGAATGRRAAPRRVHRPASRRAPDAELVPKWDSPDDILLIVAGGEAGRFSAVFGPCVGMDWNPVSLEVRCDT